MAVTITNYGRFSECLLEARVNLDVDELWTMLVTAAYTFNQHSQKFKNSVTGEVIGSGYAAGGQKVTFSAPVYESVGKLVRVPSGNLAWPAVTFTGVVGAVLYVKRIGAAENAMPLVSYMNFGETVSRSGEAFYLNWPTTGVLKVATP
jgi:hypothetical protein